VICPIYSPGRRKKTQRRKKLAGTSSGDGGRLREESGKRKDGN
jgi:hypothetical protein